MENKLPKEWIDVADTAVKIGLGALITGFFTFVGVKFSKKSEMNKFSLEHRTKLLEELSSNIEEYFSFWDMYVGQVAGIARGREIKNTETEALTKNQKEAINLRDKDLIAASPLIEGAAGKLRLINAIAAANELANCKGLQSELRDPIVFEKTFPSYSDIKIYREKTKEQKLKVHQELAKFYEAIHT
jgi:hypothetical protein